MHVVINFVYAISGNAHMYKYNISYIYLSLRHKNGKLDLIMGDTPRFTAKGGIQQGMRLLRFL